MSGFKDSPGGLPPPARTLWDTLGVPDRSHPWGDRLSTDLMLLFASAPTCETPSKSW